MGSEVPATPARDLTDQHQQQDQPTLQDEVFHCSLPRLPHRGLASVWLPWHLFNGFRGNRGGGRRPASGGGRGGNCGGGHRPNHQFGGQNFLVSWRLGCSGFTQGQGENFCRANGMRPISINNSAKESEFTRLVSREGQKYFWTGGKVNRGRISWPSGRSYNNVNWSHTGGAGRRQPDNREGDEFCVGVLNNFYNDGVRFHDISCHHRKPIICES